MCYYGILWAPNVIVFPVHFLVADTTLTTHTIVLCSDILLVTENKEDRKTWIDALQDQNPELLDPKHHTHRIQADTPQGSRRGSAVQPESSLQRERQSSLVTTSIRSMADPDDQSSYSNRPGSPRHSIHRLESDSSTTSGSGSMDYLDIQHLNIREGPSDTEDGPTNI